MQLMLCIESSIRTNTTAGLVYEAVGAFVCSSCGHVSEILEFAPPVAEFDVITCRVCKHQTIKTARYSNRKRFIPLNDPDLIDDSVSETNADPKIVPETIT